MAENLKLGKATMPWNTWPASAARYDAGTEIRPLRSILLMKVSMNRAIDCAIALQSRGSRARNAPLDGRRRHRNAAESRTDPPVGTGSSSECDGIPWDIMGVNGKCP